MGMSSEMPWPRNLKPRGHGTSDAVVVVPGLMGSELLDTVTGDLIWGLRGIRWYVRAWSSGKGLAPLAVTDNERAGRVGRVKASGLLRFPAFAPLLAGFEPYTPLVHGIQRVVEHPSAVLEFAYDWRLPVQHNAQVLAEKALAHLKTWQTRSGHKDARLVLVAHSMGGLLCRALTTISGALDDVRAVITLGTPFGGAAKAAMLLATGQGAPLPRDRLRGVATTMPGIYELLPSYRCLDEGDTARALTPKDIGSFGADTELATAAFDQRAALSDAALPGHRALMGVEQPTLSSLTLADGVLTGHDHTFGVQPDGELARQPSGILERLKGLGDATVPRNSALPRGVSPVPLAQQHGALARSPEAITFVCDVLVHGEADRGPSLGAGDIGLSLPDIVAPGVEWTATITGVAPHEARCTITDLDTGHPATHPPLHRRDDAVAVTTSLPAPGVYRVEVAGGGSAPVSQLLMVEDPTAEP